MINSTLNSENSNKQHCPLIAIGGSAGALKALIAILKNVGQTLPAAIVVIQHLDEDHADGLISVLSEHSSLPVVSAVQGMSPTINTVFIARTNDHLILNAKCRFEYQTEPLTQVYRPSVDEFFASAALHWQGKVTAVLLSGMGDDGALGLLALRRLGHFTIAQEKTSCGVYGMPKAAALRNAAIEILTPTDIAVKIRKLHATT